MLQKFRENYPIGAIILLLLSYINIDYHSASPAWSAHFPGTVAGIAVMCIIGFVLLYRIVDALHIIAIAKGYLPEKVRYKYDILLLIGFVAVIFQTELSSTNMIQNFEGGMIPQWKFSWGRPKFMMYFIIALIVLVLLLRVTTVLSAIVRHAQNS